LAQARGALGQCNLEMVHNIGRLTMEWIAAKIGENGVGSTMELTAIAKVLAHGERRNNTPFYRRGGMASNIRGGSSGMVGTMLCVMAAGSLLMTSSRGGWPRLATSWWRG
jgi:hypothetical protein